MASDLIVVDENIVVRFAIPVKCRDRDNNSKTIRISIRVLFRVAYYANLCATLTINFYFFPKRGQNTNFIKNHRQFPVAKLSEFF